MKNSLLNRLSAFMLAAGAFLIAESDTTGAVLSAFLYAP